MARMLALLADIANGLFALTLAAMLTGTPVLWWHICIAIPLAMLPDIDALPELLQRRRVSASAVSPHDHRTFLHYPLFALLLLMGLVVVGNYWTLMAAIALVLHLVNDLYGTGFGLPLLWPLSRTRYKFFGRRVNRLKHILVSNGDWEKLSEDERRLRFVVSWTEREFPLYVQQWGIDDWIPMYYYNINWISAVEYMLFTLSILFLYLQLS